MSKRFNEYNGLNLPGINESVLGLWDAEDVFNHTMSDREGCPSFVFFEGPPSANGKPGIHHVLARTIKDIFCRYKTMKGFQVKRKAGWDTHGLPVELGVEKNLGITKEDIGKKISVDDYNAACIGRDMTVLCEHRARSGMCSGRTYADSPEIDGTVYFTGAARPGDMVTVHITGCDDGDLAGEQIHE